MGGFEYLYKWGASLNIVDSKAAGQKGGLLQRKLVDELSCSSLIPCRRKFDSVSSVLFRTSFGYVTVSNRNY